MSCNELSTLLIDGSSIETNIKELFLGKTIDKDLKLMTMSITFIKITCQKLNALCRLVVYMDIEKGRIIMKAFIQSQFRYRPLVWMFHRRGINNKR